MPDIIIDWLNNFNAGSALLVVLALGTAAITVGRKLWKLTKDAKALVESNLKKKEEYQNVLSDVEAIKQDITALKTNSAEVMEKIKNSSLYSTEVDESLKRAITAAEEMASKHTTAISKIEQDILTMQGKINLLFASDKEFCRSYIIDAYSKYVGEEHAIGLLALQNIEGMYNRYKDEHGEDEFLGKMVREMRNLPTINK